MQGDGPKTMIAAAVLAAAVGVYVELTYQEKLKKEAALRELRGLPPLPSASASAAPVSTAPEHHHPGAAPSPK